MAQRVTVPNRIREGVREVALLRGEGGWRVRAGNLIQALRSPQSLGQKAAVNSGWLIGEQLLRMTVTFLITVLIIRHLGPTDYGILAYGIAVILIIDVVATVGMRSVLVSEIVKNPEDESEIVGTAITMRMAGSVVLALGTVAMLWALGTDSTSLMVLLVLSASLPIWSLGALELAFMATYQSQFTVYARLSALVVTSVLRIVFLLAGAPLMAFAIATAVEFIAVGAFMAVVYRSTRLPLRSFRVTRQMAKRLITLSWPLFISALAATVYLKVDQVMLLHIAGSTEVGVYAAGSRISEVWFFIPIAVASSLLPVFVTKFKEGIEPYRAALQRAYVVTFWIAIAIAVAVTVAAPLVVVLYGSAYSRTVDILRIHVWAIPFIFVGNVLGRALIAENRRRLEMTRHSIGAALNISLNLVLIPMYGGIGAAIATIASYSFASYFVCFAYRPAWPHAKLMTRAIIWPLRPRGSSDEPSDRSGPDGDAPPPSPRLDDHDNGPRENRVAAAQPSTRVNGVRR